jgi:aminopeptidase N
MPKILVIIGLLAVLSSAALCQDKGYDVISYDVTISLDRQNNTIKGVAEMSAKSTAGLSSILQHLKSLSIDSVFVGSSRASLSVVDSTGEYQITNFPTLSPGSIFQVRTYYHGAPTNEGGSNPWGGVINDGKMMFAMGVGFSAPYISCTRHWMPCYDLPDDKADSVTLTFITPNSDVVVSNGLRVSDLPIADHRHATNWQITHPIASYLLTFAVGPFVEQTIANPLQIPFQCFSYQSDSARLSVDMYKRVVEALVYFDSLYGAYPFEKVGYVVAPIGSMEHQTMITLVNSAIDTNSTTAQHELSHMWWGDWVTCKDFNDPWLNEGFAMYSESLFLERFTGRTAYWTRQHQNVSAAISSGSKIPMYGAPFLTSPRNNYPYPVIYQKGAAVLGMLRYYLGDQSYFKAIRDYGKTHGYSTATSADLQKSFETSTGQDLAWFFKEWVYGIWYPQIKLSWAKRQSGYQLFFNQTQDLSKYQLFRIPFVVEARTKAGQNERATVWMDSVVQSSASVNCSFVPDTIVVDPDGAVIKKIVGAVLNVTPKENLLYGLTFSPNPSQQSGIELTVSTLPDTYPDYPNEAYYIEKRLQELVVNNGTLLVYDSNGRVALRQELSKPITTEALTFKYPIATGSLSSGTYFAKVLLKNNSLVGEGQFIVTK